MLRTATIAFLSMTLLTAPAAASGDAPERRVTRDRLEDVRDRRENRWDARHQGGRRDRREDLRDRRENRRDHREDVRDRWEDRRDRRR